MVSIHKGIIYQSATAARYRAVGLAPETGPLDKAYYGDRADSLIPIAGQEIPVALTTGSAFSIPNSGRPSTTLVVFKLTLMTLARRDLKSAGRPSLARQIYVVMGDQRLQFDGYVKVVARVSADGSVGGITGLRV